MLSVTDIPNTIMAAIQSVQMMNDVIQAARSFSKDIELKSAVSEVQAKLSAALSAALSAQQGQLALTQRISELEKENTELKNWGREAERYQLGMVAIGAFVYMPKPGMENNEPAHYLCTNCFNKGEKSILQADAPGPPVYKYHCPRCKSEIRVAAQPLQVRLTRG